jgi:chemotaxis family two-component system sensor kinase Cph1
MATKNYDSEFCGSLPLQNINLIQPYGCLLVLHKTDLTVLQVSENIGDLLGTDASLVVNASVNKFLSTDKVAELKAKATSNLKDSVPINLVLSNEDYTTPVTALLHVKENYLILELEKVSDGVKPLFMEVYQGLRYAIAEINNTETIEDACKKAIEHVQKLSGFKKVLMYQFDKQWNGTVIAEVKHPEMESYMGLTFPASDVPRQARELYLKNPFRLIPNRDYTPVRLFPVINPVTHSFVDLSSCNLRSVAGVHLEYMKNMGTAASMSLRVIKDGTLWGLISCHNNEPKYLSYEECATLEMLSEVISAKISSIINQQNFTSGTVLQNMRTRIIEHLFINNDLANSLLLNESDNVLKLFNAGGAAIIQGGRVQIAGIVPHKDDIENLSFWLAGKGVDKIYSNSNLAEVYDEALAYADIASGILVIPLDTKNGDYVVAFRPQVVETINWGGNPDEAINFEADKTSYHPRHSFGLWKQQVFQTSLPWTENELAAAEGLKNFILEFKTKSLAN